MEIGSRPHDDVVQVIELFGGTALVDVVNPAPVPFTVVYDFEQAAWWLDLVYGRPAVQVIGALWRDESGEDIDESADLEVGPRAKNVNRLGIGMWIYHWWPSSDTARSYTVDREKWALLDLEVGVQAWACEHVLGGLQLADQFLSPHVESFRFSYPDDAGRPLPAPDVLAEPTLLAMLESVPMDDPLYDQLDAVHESNYGEAATVVVDDDISALQVVEAVRGPRVFRGQRPGAVVAGAVGPPDFVGGVDLAGLPSRLVSASDDALTWTRDEGFIGVRVLAGDGPFLSEVWVRVYDQSAGRLPVALFQLYKEGDRFTGRGEIPGAVPAGADLLVDVFTPGWMCEPDPERARAERARAAEIAVRISASFEPRPVDEMAYHFAPRTEWFGLTPLQEA